MEDTLNKNIFSLISLRIIKEQEIIIGPLAWEEASKVSGLKIIDSQKGDIVLDGNEKEILNKLVAQYEKLFGKISHKVCREAVKDLISKLKPEEVPSSLI